MTKTTGSVSNTEPSAADAIPPAGFRFAGVACGLKRDPTTPDLALITSDRPAVAAGVYTTNLVYAAPVAWDRARTPGGGFRAVAINSGNANACTGARGLADAEAMARAAGATCGVGAEQALVMSTGVIGVFLPVEKVTAGIDVAAGALEASSNGLRAAARAIMTTDSVPKHVSQPVSIGSRTFRLAGLAKGAAMIGPRLATMLGLMTTDAPLRPDDARRLISVAAEASFNAISVDGHMSTNDTVLLVANGAAGGPELAGAELEAFQTALTAACARLARAIPADGEGCTHLIEITVSGARTEAEARTLARSVADSPLVKCAVHGADPNWGRIVSAAGYAGVPFDPQQVSLRVNGIPLYEAGAPVAFDRVAASASIRENRETRIELRFGEGRAEARFWSADLTAEYVRLNADYFT
jgi:glutamate N-acetyltransferase/amino-acid N-acetyltransferase